MFWTSETLKNVFPNYTKTTKLNIVVPSDEDNHKPGVHQSLKFSSTKQQSPPLSPIHTDMLDLSIPASASSPIIHKHKSYRNISPGKKDSLSVYQTFPRHSSKKSKIHSSSKNDGHKFSESPTQKSDQSNLGTIIDNFMTSFNSQQSGSPTTTVLDTSIDSSSILTLPNYQQHEPLHRFSIPQKHVVSDATSGIDKQRFTIGGFVASPINFKSSPSSLNIHGQEVISPIPGSPILLKSSSFPDSILSITSSSSTQNKMSSIQKYNLRAIRKLEENGQTIEQLVDLLRKLHSDRLSSCMHHVFFMKKLFDSYELDEQKRIDFKNFRNFICSMFGSLSTEEYRALFAYFDTTHAGKISWNAFFWKINKSL